MPFPELQSIPCERRDYPEWHRGRRRYAVWSLPVDCPTVLARLQRARTHLGDWLHDDHRRQAHITLFVCGFPSASPRFDDDFPGERLAAQLAALHARAGAPFELQVGGLASFASAAYLRVSDPAGRLQALRTMLERQGAEIRQGPYRPHLTVGLYARPVARAVLQRRLEACAEPASLTLAVRELHYSTYLASDLFGPLRVEQRLALA